MTVLKNPGSSATVEVATVQPTEGVRPEPKLALALALASRPHDRRFVPLSTAACFCIALLLGLLAISVDSLALAALAWLAAISIACGRALLGLVRILRGDYDDDELTVAKAIVTSLGNALLAGFGTYVAYLATFGFSRGRQLRRWGRVLLPALRTNEEWARRAMTLDSGEVPAGLADQWRENGKTEHASVAAFARLTLDLMALGAPPKLVADANRDALDEIRHAEMCFSLATALDGRRVSPAPFPQAQRVSSLPRARSLALAQLAVSSLVDGALHEGVSARIIARLAKRCGSPEIREMLKSIAADEGRHSAHGWDVVAWCVEQGGAGVTQALRGALRALPSRMSTRLPAGAADGGWERWGIHGHALEAEEYGKALALVTDRVRALATTATRQAA